MRYLAVILLTPLAMTGCASNNPGKPQPDTYTAEVDAWHAQRLAALRSDTGWLTLAGLHRLEPGTHSLGRAPDNDIVLPASPAPHLGTLTIADDQLRFTAADGATVTVFEQEPPEAVADLTLACDAEGSPTVLTSGSLLFHVIDRSGELFLRVRDRNSPILRNFRGIDRFPVDPRYRVTARLIPDTAGSINITNVLGQIETSPCPGQLEFTLLGQTLRLRPTTESDGSLFFVFGDTTNSSTTYGAGRFLSADPIGDDGTVVLDFNRARNPYCAFSEYATCPLPPAGNRLPIAIEAGEKIPN